MVSVKSKKHRIRFQMFVVVGTIGKNDNWTHSEIVTNSSPQFEKPMSIPATTPVGASFLNDFFHSMCTRDLPVKHLYRIRMMAEMTSFNIKWYNTTVNGKWNFWNENAVDNDVNGIQYSFFFLTVRLIAPVAWLHNAHATWHELCHSCNKNENRKEHVYYLRTYLEQISLVEC